MSRGRRTETGRLNITVKDGVDVNYQMYGDKKGSYFQGSVPEQDVTVRVEGGSRTLWNLVLDDLETGERRTFQFSHEMLIGRTPPLSQSQVKLVLNKDASVSGNHCRIFEMSERLVIMDLGSRNHTYLNGMQVQQATELPMYGQIQVGKSAFRVVYMEKK